jgi:hypothetical protein
MTFAVAESVVLLLLVPHEAETEQLVANAWAAA